jgi:UDP-3-O-[3-hydroxymyristoyl] glucosamine N-acyltransferase
MIRESDGETIAQLLEKPLFGPPFKIKDIDRFPNRKTFSLSFLQKEIQDIGPAVKCAMVICIPVMKEKLLSYGYTVVESDTPKYDYGKIFRQLLECKAPAKIHTSAVIGEDVVLGRNIHIGPGCFLEGRITVGDECRIGANVCLVNEVTLGKGVRIRNGTVIGEDAYSFGFDQRGHSIRVPSASGVQIHDEVEIGNNVVISRGVSEDTQLLSYSRVNDLAHLGNAVVLGKFSVVMANCDISGRVVIGEGCWIGQSSAIRQGVRIGDKSLVGMGSVVVKDVKAGVVVMGVPAKEKGPRK